MKMVFPGAIGDDEHAKAFAGREIQICRCARLGATPPTGLRRVLENNFNVTDFAVRANFVDAD